MRWMFWDPMRRDKWGSSSLMGGVAGCTICKAAKRVSSWASAAMHAAVSVKNVVGQARTGEAPHIAGMVLVVEAEAQDLTWHHALQ